ncbi:hypothetical protein [Corynebacterium sp. A21]|uniref:hypothetical protein n=1 Tax=Corynebacterium sp. A21 TaxID=3457318 RepID=UPI003FD566BE
MLSLIFGGLFRWCHVWHYVWCRVDAIDHLNWLPASLASSDQGEGLDKELLATGDQVIEVAAEQARPEELHRCRLAQPGDCRQGPAPELAL